jgi:hypothetical protein
MIITLNLITEPTLHKKFEKLETVLSMLQSFFQDKTYGVSVNEIAGGLVCNTPFQLQFIGIGMEYGKRKKAISFLTKIDMDWVEQHEESLVRLESKRLLIETFAEFETLGIKEFDTASFVRDFELYLNIVETSSPEKLQELMPPWNEQTIKVHEAKWKRFLNS